MASEAPGRRCAPEEGSGRAPRPARPGDLPGILAIERDCFSVPWSERSFRHVMERADAGLLVSGDGRGGVAGYAAYWVVDGKAELADLAVRPDHRRRGLGRDLVEAVCREAERREAEVVFLQVRESNAAARELYLSAGFRDVGRRSRYYRLPAEDAVVLARSLPSRSD